MICPRCDAYCLGAELEVAFLEHAEIISPAAMHCVQSDQLVDNLLSDAKISASSAHAEAKAKAK